MKEARNQKLKVKIGLKLLEKFPCEHAAIMVGISPRNLLRHAKKMEIKLKKGRPSRRMINEDNGNKRKIDENNNVLAGGGKLS